uniref:Uncharacterized protein n=1 Tax=Micrurus lemniscatus lemniscatus TaxID=129467 RepID=A0A2D4IFC6_MICLE
MAYPSAPDVSTPPSLDWDTPAFHHPRDLLPPYRPPSFLAANVLHSHQAGGHICPPICFCFHTQQRGHPSSPLAPSLFNPNSIHTLIHSLGKTKHQLKENKN